MSYESGAWSTRRARVVHFLHALLLRRLRSVRPWPLSRLCCLPSGERRPNFPIGFLRTFAVPGRKVKKGKGRDKREKETRRKGEIEKKKARRAQAKRNHILHENKAYLSLQGPGLSVSAPACSCSLSSRFTPPMSSGRLGDGARKWV